MNRLFAPALIALTLVAPTAAAEMRNVTGFNSVRAEDRMTVTVSVGEGYSVEVTGSDAGRIRTHLDGRTLKIEDANRPWFGRNPPLDAHVRVTLPAIEGVSAARGAQLTASLAGASCGDFSAVASMGGATRVEAAQCSEVEAAASMGGEVNIAGTCRTLSVSASMGAFVRAEDLHCATVDASASMGGEIDAYASQSYDASASMGGSINVVGGGAASDRRASMGGSIRGN